jgi:beta-glucosidase
MNTANAGSYDYASTVLYPFGYGLSYTTFQWSNYSCTVENGTVTVSVDVKNTGTKAGKDVVQIYYQSQYTDFDKTNGIEKAAVNLVEFGKTGMIEPSKSETVTVSFPITDMKCYDVKTNKTYILEAGDYYITAASNAHEAVNNILLKKNYTEDLVGTGNADNAYKYEQAETQICKEGATADVSNVFDGALLNGVTYLSRNNWSVLDGSVDGALSNVLGAGAITSATAQVAGKSNVTGQSGTIGTLEATAEMQAALTAEGYEASGNPKAKNSYTANKTYGQDSGLELVDLREKEYSDEDWDKLLNQMKFSEIYELFGHAGYGTIEVKSINKPKTMEYDGPTGFNSFVNDTSGYGFPNEISMAATWNKELLEQEGILIGNDAIFMSAGADRMSGWYAPAVNIHRTAFSGRNYEYYSEDPVLSGKLAANVIKGVQSKGVYVYLKHYALNDQETNRSAYNHVATFASEQTIREIYLKSFELGVIEGGAKGIMTSMNRVGATWATGNYALNTTVLRNEWGFKGVIVTDYVSASPVEADQMLASGVDLILTTGWDKTKGALSDYNADWARAELRRAAHNTLYVQANSVAMNGFVHGTAYNAGFPVYKILLIVVWIVVAAAIGVGGFFVYRTIFWSQDKWYARKRISKKGWIIIGTVTAAVVIALLLTFFLWLWPILSTAFVL